MVVMEIELSPIERELDLKLRKRFGITVADYQRMLSVQDGKCAICGEESTGRRLSVDHDHVTGRVRGLLCMKCNTGIGMFRDDIELVKAAVLYLI